MKHKTKYFVLLLLLAIIGVIILTKFETKEIKLDNVSLKEQISNMNGLAIMTEQSDGSYSDYKTIPLKEDGYIFNKTKSGCVDNLGNMITDAIEYRNNMVRVETDATSSCVLYFDLIGEGDFCIEQGITDFNDCLLVMEDYSYDTEEAIEYIENKGSATTNKIAPIITYKSVSENRTGNVVSFTSTIPLGTSYSFSSSTGMYTLAGSIKEDELSDKYKEYYTCAVNGQYMCSTLYKINAYTKEINSYSATYTITDSDVYTYKALDSYDSEVGLYATTDDDGTTYFYRGAVKNNYVLFGGYIWRIIRINGNGTIRMIYAGTSAEEIGVDDQIGGSLYNSKNGDPTYVGYKYSDDDFIFENSTILTTYSNINSSKVYYYAKSYINDATNRTFKISGDVISGIWSETYETAISEGYKYTCFNANLDATCNNLVQLDSYVSPTSAKGYYISYNSPNYVSTLQNKTDSTIKSYTDNWYALNMVGKTDSNGQLITNYISDEVFCNDRGIYSGTGYLISSTTYYKTYQRIESQFAPSLSCSQTSDKFSVANGNLTYPVALITIDELNLAGGTIDTINEQFFLYTGQSYWTMSPSKFLSGYESSFVFAIYSNGALGNNFWVTASHGVRPVINLKSSVKITKGTGTASNPYELTIE